MKMSTIRSTQRTKIIGDKVYISCDAKANQKIIDDNNLMILMDHRGNMYHMYHPNDSTYVKLYIDSYAHYDVLDQEQVILEKDLRIRELKQEINRLVIENISLRIPRSVETIKNEQSGVKLR